MINPKDKQKALLIVKQLKEINRELLSMNIKKSESIKYY